MLMISIGILGGGQLAALLMQEASTQPSAFNIIALDESADCPAAVLGADVIVGSPHIAEDVRKLAEKVDVITLDREAVNVDVLKALESEGVKVIPNAACLTRLTNKLTQKQFLAKHGIATSEFIPMNVEQEDQPVDSPFGFPVVQKLAQGGYDGRGVSILKSADDPARLVGVGYLEKLVDYKLEIAVMVIRGAGKTVTYPPVEMVFNENNTLDFLLAPARLTPEVSEKAVSLAKTAIDAFESDGVFGVEMFVDQTDDVLINEIAPRTHNSGHHTIDAFNVSQFGQQLLILNGEAPADPIEQQSAAMLNLLGPDDVDGPSELSSTADESYTKIHWYGKTQCFPGRKMGHVTVLGSTAEEAIQRANEVRTQIHIRPGKADSK